MITGFAYRGEAASQQFTTTDELRDAWTHDDVVVWVDVQEPDEATLGALRDLFGLDEAALEDCIIGEQRPRVDEFEDHLFLVLYGLVGLSDPTEFDPRKLAIFCGRRFIVTVHREALRTIQTLIERCTRKPAHVLAKGTDAVLYQIIDGMVDRYGLVADNYERRIETLEEASLSPTVDEVVLHASSVLRKELLHLRNLATSLRELLAPMARGEFEYVSESLEQRFNHVSDHVRQVIELVDALRENLHSIRDNYNSALANHTNEVMKVLTIFATIMLPLTFIAGVYGMNLPLWPPQDEPASFWYVMGAMLATAVALLWFFRRRRWI